MTDIHNSARGALKLKDAADYLGGISEVSVRRLIDRNLITPNRSLRHILIPVTELDRFLQNGMVLPGQAHHRPHVSDPAR